jgi:hypothetical protein
MILRFAQDDTQLAPCPLLRQPKFRVIGTKAGPLHHAIAKVDKKLLIIYVPDNRKN